MPMIITPGSAKIIPGIKRKSHEKNNGLLVMENW
jgi:hypothetical protein